MLAVNKDFSQLLKMCAIMSSLSINTPFETLCICSHSNLTAVVTAL